MRVAFSRIFSERANVIPPQEILVALHLIESKETEVVKKIIEGKEEKVGWHIWHVMKHLIRYDTIDMLWRIWYVMTQLTRYDTFDTSLLIIFSSNLYSSDPILLWPKNGFQTRCARSCVTATRWHQTPSLSHHANGHSNAAEFPGFGPFHYFDSAKAHLETDLEWWCAFWGVGEML